MILEDLAKRKLIHPPRWMISNTCYLTVMGSNAYAASGDTSDVDVYGFCLPPKEMVFPHLAGTIQGFGTQVQKFDQWSEHHIKHPDKDTEYDFTVFGIVRYFQLCMENNPNTLDSLFVPRRCIMHSTGVSEHMRTNRRIFLHKGAMGKFRGYAFSQMSKIRNKTNSSNPKRAATIERHGYDTKFLMHVVRLALECEQILVEGDLDLERNGGILKSVRRGEWTLEQAEDWFTNKERALETCYANSTLPHSPDETRIKQILLECLEMHYGSLDTVIAKNPSMEAMISDLQAVLHRYSSQELASSARPSLWKRLLRL